MSTERIDFSGVRSNDPTLCKACREDRHWDCWRHDNDGAVDAMDFIPVFCKCTCYRTDEYWYTPAELAEQRLVEFMEEYIEWQSQQEEYVGCP